MMNVKNVAWNELNGVNYIAVQTMRWHEEFRDNEYEVLRSLVPEAKEIVHVDIESGYAAWIVDSKETAVKVWNRLTHNSTIYAYHLSDCPEIDAYTVYPGRFSFARLFSDEYREY